MEQLTQSAAESIGVEGTRGGEFGGGVQEARDDQSQDQIALAAGLPVDKAIEFEFAQGTEDGGDVAMKAGANDIKGLRQRGGERSCTLEDSAKRVDLSLGPMREIGGGTVADFAVGSKDSRRRMAGGELRLGRWPTLHVYITMEGRISVIIYLAHYMTATIRAYSSLLQQNKRAQRFRRWNFGLSPGYPRA